MTMGTELSAAAARWRMERSLARSAALIEAERKIEAHRTELQRRIHASILAGASITEIARETGLGRSTIYKWRDEYDPIAETLSEAPSEWAVTHVMSGEFLITHPGKPDLMGTIDEDGMAFAWNPEGHYRPIYQESQHWVDLGYGDLLPALTKAHSAWIEAGGQMVWQPEQ